MIYELWEGKLPKGWQLPILNHKYDIKEQRYPCGRSKMYRSPTYQSWFGMVTRCTYPYINGSKSYHGAGVKVCVRWIEGDGEFSGFLCFLIDMGERPEGRTIDRIDPTGHYTPDNCRWADAKTQAMNKRPRTKKAA